LRFLFTLAGFLLKPQRFALFNHSHITGFKNFFNKRLGWRNVKHWHRVVVKPVTNRI